VESLAYILRTVLRIAVEVAIVSRKDMEFFEIRTTPIRLEEYEHSLNLIVEKIK
jgi:hypothetical protein